MAAKKQNPRERESYVHLFLDGKKVGEFGPYQTMRGALADAKTMAISRRDAERASTDLPVIVHTHKDDLGQDKAYEVMADYRQTDEELDHSFIAKGVVGKTAAARSGSSYSKPAAKAETVRFNPTAKVPKSKRKNPQISFLAHGKPVSFFSKKGK